MTLTGSRLCVAAAVLAVVPVAPRALADTVIRQKKSSPAHAAMGQQVPASESTVTTWIGKGRLRTEDGTGKAVILREDLDRAWYLDLREKTYREMPLRSGESAAGPTVAGKVEAVVTDTGEEKLIGSWPCRRYTVLLRVPLGNAAPPGETVSDVWTSSAIEADARLYGRLSNLMISRRPGSADALRELEKVRGFPVLRVDRFSLMQETREVTLELLEVSRGEAPEGGYEVPDGYSRAGF